MKSSFIDLLEHVAAAYQQGSCTNGKVAAQFSVSDSFVRKLRRRQRMGGSVDAGLAAKKKSVHAAESKKQ